MLPELASLHRCESIVRIPPSQDVPVSDRVRRILDTAPVRRLAAISQLGMVQLVYPGATHSRLEHSLGVYHNALKLLARFSDADPGACFFSQTEAEAFLLATLLHDVGHWPFCHPIEDMRLAGLGKHESRLESFLATGELAQAIASDWSCSIDQIVSMMGLNDLQNATPGQVFLASCLSSPIDVDKLDYLRRDSLHAGVPYGQNFDSIRLISATCRHPETGKLAVKEKGRTAAEMMVFARYVMFSEVYWHHAVRSATAMLQRAVYVLRDRMDLASSLKMNDAQWITMLRGTAQGTPAETMVDGLFGDRRRLFKRIAEYSVLQSDSGVHRMLSRQPYWWLVAASEKLARQVRQKTGFALDPLDILVDAPPVKLEVDINIDVVGRDGQIRTLGEVSPVASALAHRQFDNHVKRVRVFVRADLRDLIQQKIAPGDWEPLLLSAADQVENEIA